MHASTFIACPAYTAQLSLNILVEQSAQYMPLSSSEPAAWPTVSGSCDTWTGMCVSCFASDHIMPAGVTIQAPQLDINTVAAGGGSRLFYRKGVFEVGPESAGAQPGPVCYRCHSHMV